MKLSPLLVAAAAFASQAAAQDLPALYDVSGVAANDVLNVREDPRATASRIGELAPDRTGVEVVELSSSGDWGRVNLGEFSGWVNMSYLAAQPVPEGTYFDRPLRCFGTEPFWTVIFTPGQPAAMTTPEGAMAPMDFGTVLSPANGGASTAALGQDADGGSHVALVRRAECSDGMSDGVYGLGFDLVSVTAEGGKVLTGCCTLAMR